MQINFLRLSSTNHIQQCFATSELHICSNISNIRVNSGIKFTVSFCISKIAFTFISIPRCTVPEFTLPITIRPLCSSKSKFVACKIQPHLLIGYKFVTSFTRNNLVNHCTALWRTSGINY